MTDRDPGDLLGSDDTFSETKFHVINILREKRAEARILSEDSFHEHPNAEDCLETMPTFYYEENVAKCAADLKGGAGLCGVKGTMLRNLLLHHEVRSEKLREDMALWTEWLSNGFPRMQHIGDFTYAFNLRQTNFLACVCLNAESHGCA